MQATEYMAQRDRERFERRVNRNGECHLFRGKPDGAHGYGRFQYDGRREQAHRIAWQLARGPIPDGLRVLHRCDVPLCVRVDHLFLGTQADNMADMDAKGRRRTPSGEHHWAAKLTDEAVREIRALRGIVPQKDLAARFGVAQSRISHVQNDQAWCAAKFEVVLVTERQEVAV